MHRHRSIRRANLAAHKISTRKAKAPGKAKAGARRDARALAVIKASPAGTVYAPWVQSWLSRRTGLAFSRLTPAAIADVLN
jgi:hypothetical protein